MSPSPTAGSWHHVESRQDFAAYLEHLAADCERACTGRATGELPAGRWTNQSVDRFLRGWARLLGHRINGTDLLHEQAPGRPGWQGLAHQLDAARTATPAPVTVGAVPGITSEQVESAEDLRTYVTALAADFDRDRQECLARIRRGGRADDGSGWAHGTLYNWLEAWAAWVGGTSPLHGQLEPVTWRSVALQLSAARIYE
ncbi:hypothetical protein ABZ883_11350 [Streptomyces sp. NPDC046977]|uniref:hypothetical protein n=1 Tax=Streptomyces sp. NPDC046977 TaxID=3154703 RepID=UPI003402EE78